MRVGQTGLVRERKGGLIENEVVDRLIWIEIAGGCHIYAGCQPCESYGERHQVQMLIKPLLNGSVRIAFVGFLRSNRNLSLSDHFLLDGDFGTH